MRRRDFIKVIAGSAAVWPLAVRAQQAAMPVVGFLNGGSAEGYAPMVRAFRAGLSEAGYVDGRNIAIEYRWADGLYDRLPAMAMDLVRHQVTAIVVNTPAAQAAQAANVVVIRVGRCFLCPDKAGELSHRLYVFFARKRYVSPW